MSKTIDKKIKELTLTSTKAGAMEVLNMFTAEALKLDDVDIMKFTRSVAVRVQERYK